MYREHAVICFTDNSNSTLCELVRYYAFPPPLRDHNDDFNSANFEIVSTGYITNVESKKKCNGGLRSIRQRQYREGCCQISGRFDVVA